MPTHFADRLLAAIQLKGAPACVGIDPVLEKLPDPSGTPVQAIERFSMHVIDEVAAVVPVVKLQLACYERYGGEGVAVFHRVLAYAKQAGLMVIADAKRGDIGVSSEHYAHSLAQADAVTISPYLGLDAMQPFVDVAAERGNGVFVLLRTSNPGSDALQNVKLADGQPFSHHLAKVLAQWGEADRGESGYSLVGVVVGATKRDEIATFRGLMPHQLFLVPGYGAQGGTLDDIRACFVAGQGALITASRSVIYPKAGSISAAAKMLQRELQLS